MDIAHLICCPVSVIGKPESISSKKLIALRRKRISVFDYKLIET